MTKMIIKSIVSLFMINNVTAKPLDCSYEAKIFDNSKFENHACNVLDNLQEFHGVSIKQYTIDYDSDRDKVYFQCDSGGGFRECSISYNMIKI